MRSELHAPQSRTNPARRLLPFLLLLGLFWLAPAKETSATSCVPLPWMCYLDAKAVDALNDAFGAGFVSTETAYPLYLDCPWREVYFGVLLPNDLILEGTARTNRNSDTLRVGRGDSGIVFEDGSVWEMRIGYRIQPFLP